MGFDNECIQNIQSLAGEYFCPVCRLLVYPHEALQSLCTHLYCKPCLTYIAGTSRACPYDGYLVTEADAKPLMETNKALADTIGKIMVCCLYQKSGCTWQGTLSESTSHCSGCAFGNSPVVCNRCGIQIVHRQVQEHAQTCLGMQQPQIQQSQGSQPVVAAGTVAGSNQTQLSIQAGAVVAASQANASQAVSASAQDPNQKAGVNPLGQVTAAAAREQWYLQQYYQNCSGYYPYHQQAVTAYLQQQLQSQSQSQASQVASASQFQATHVQPLVQSEPQLQAQTQLQTLSQDVASVMPQSQPVFQAAPASQPPNQIVAGSLPQTYPLVMSSSPVPSQAFAPSQGLQHLQTQSRSQPQPIPQAYSGQPHTQHAQVPQHQQFPGQVQSQLYIQPPPSHFKANTVQNTQHLHPAAQTQTQQLPAHVTGLQSYLQPQPNQQNQVGVSQNNMLLPHQVGTQPSTQSSHLQNLYPQQLPHLPPSLSLTPVQAQQLLGTGQLPNILSTQQLPPHQVGVSVHQHPVMQPAQQALPQLPVPRQPSMGQKPGMVHAQLHQQGPFAIQHPPLQSHIRPQNPPNVLQKYPQNMQPHQPIIPNHGLQPQMNQHPAIALYGGAAQPAPNKPDENLGDIQTTKNQSHLASNGQGEIASRPAVGKPGDVIADRGKDDKEIGSTSDGAAMNPLNNENDVKSNDEETKTNVDSEAKGNQIDRRVESEQGSSTAVEDCETKKEPLAKQMMEEKATNGLVSLMKDAVLEGKGNKDGPSVRATPLKEADRPEQKIGNIHKDRELPQTHVSLGSSSGGNQQSVNPGLLDFQQRAAVPSGQIPLGVPHYMPAPKYPSSVFKPHGPKLLPGTPPRPAAAPSFDGGLRPHDLGRHVADSIYDQGHLLPFHAPKVSRSAVNSFAPGLRDERFKPLPNDRLNPISLELAGGRLFGEDFKHFPRPSPLDGDTFPRLGAHPSRSFDGGFGMGISPGPREKYGVDFNSGPTSRFLRTSNDLGEAPLGFREDGRERLEAARIHPDFHRPVPGVVRQHIDGPSSPVSEFPRMVSHGYTPIDNVLGGVRSGMNTEGRDRFGFHSHLLRMESEGHGNLRMGEPLIGVDMRRGDHFGPHGLSSHLRFEEQVGFDGFPHRRPGDPGFRSRYSLQGFPNDSGSFLGDMKPFENSGKRKLATMGWCRICKVDCETVEGLDLHSQTKEHQKRSMDMVVMIKQNAKKSKVASADYSPHNNPNKMKKANSMDYDSKKNAIS